MKLADSEISAIKLLRLALYKRIPWVKKWIFCHKSSWLHHINSAKWPIGCWERAPKIVFRTPAKRFRLFCGDKRIFRTGAEAFQFIRSCSAAAGDAPSRLPPRQQHTRHQMHTEQSAAASYIMIFIFLQQQQQNAALFRMPTHTKQLSCIW